MRVRIEGVGGLSVDGEGAVWIGDCGTRAWGGEHIFCCEGGGDKGDETQEEEETEHWRD